MSKLPRAVPIARRATSALALVSFCIPALAQAQTEAQVTPQMRSQAMALMQICRGDYDRLCSGVTPGGGRILACLQSHVSQLTPACAAAMPNAEALKNSAVSGGVMPK